MLRKLSACHLSLKVHQLITKHRFVSVGEKKCVQGLESNSRALVALMEDPCLVAGTQLEVLNHV